MFYTLTIKIYDDPLRLFLSGGAGVGKSSVTNALYEALTRYLNCVLGENLDEAKVLKVAPMGKAAFNIKGNTLHLKYLPTGNFNSVHLIQIGLINYNTSTVKKTESYLY